jgi:hypothetical protein
MKEGHKEDSRFGYRDQVAGPARHRFRSAEGFSFSKRAAATPFPAGI